MNYFWSHLKTVSTHKKHVRKICWRLGLFWQGLMHDLSKYSPTEMSIVKYYTGKNSPHQNCREAIGYSPCWMHHYHKNKHHYQYWQDQDENDKNIPIKMPYKYVLEMFADRVSACKAYNKDKYTNQDAWNYYAVKTKGHGVLHEETEYLLEKLLWNLHESKTEDDFFEWFNRASKFLSSAYEANQLKAADLHVSQMFGGNN